MCAFQIFLNMGLFWIFLVLTRTVPLDGTSQSNMNRQSVFTVEKVNKSLPILQTHIHDGNFLTCTSLCLELETCYALNVQMTDHKCNTLADERYLQVGTYGMKLIEGSVWIMQKTCPEPYMLVTNGCYYLDLSLSNWNSAKEVCENMHPNGRLAEFHSESDMATVIEYILGTSATRLMAYWVGGIR